MIIDGHAHACGPFSDCDSTLQLLDEIGVEKVVLVPGEIGSRKTYSLPNIARWFPNRNVVRAVNLVTRPIIGMTGALDQIPEGNEQVFRMVSELKGRAVQFIWVTGADKDPREYLNHKFPLWQFKGVKLHQCWERFSIASRFFECTAGWVEDQNMPLFLHPWSDNDITDIIDYKKKHPDLKLILAHLFGMEKFIKAGFKDQNLYFDISPTPLISRDRLQRAIAYFGVTQIVLGSDTPYGKDTLKRNVDRIRNIDLADSDKAAILGKNMKRLLKI